LRVFGGQLLDFRTPNPEHRSPETPSEGKTLQNFGTEDRMPKLFPSRHSLAWKKFSLIRITIVAFKIEDVN
jgi:hypothetical protein